MNPMALLHTLAGRIALSAAALGLGVMAVVSVLGYLALAHQLKLRATEDLDAKRTLLRHILSEIPSASALASNRHRLDDLLLGHQDLHLAVFDATGSRVIATFSSLAKDAAPLILERLTASRLTDESPMREWTAPSGQRLLVTVGTARFASAEMAQIALFQDQREDSALLSNYARALIIVLPLALLIVLAGAWLTARSGLWPLRRFATVAGSISSQSLTGRIEVQGLPTELRALAKAFNAMLDRIDEGVTRLTQFSGDLAHEMRTPIAILLGRTQVALSKPRDAAALQDTLASNVEELERMTRLIADMLFLAQSEQDKGSLSRETLQLEAEASLVAEFLSDVAADRQLSINVTGKATILANRILVQRAITNLLSNAIRHATVATAIEIDIRNLPNGVTLHISNCGRPIPEAHLKKIFERFYRAEADRGRDSGGTGLGLAIVRSIMQMHDGEVTVTSSANDGTAFQLQFPSVTP